MDNKTRNALNSLDLTPGASLADVKKSYRELALIWHPDKVPQQVKDRATTKFTEINEAYQWLSRNPDRLSTSASYGTSSQRRSPPRPSSASGYTETRSSQTRTSQSGPGYSDDPAVKGVRRAARGISTDTGAGIYIYPQIDAVRAANFIASLQQNPIFKGAASTVNDLLVFYDIDGSGEEGMAITRSNLLVNNNTSTLYDIGELVEVRMKEGFFVPWGEIEVRRKGRRRFESAGYAEKSPGRALASILQNLVAEDRAG